MPIELSDVIVLEPVCVVCGEWIKVVEFTDSLSVILGCGCKKNIFFSWNGYEFFNQLSPVGKSVVLNGLMKVGSSAHETDLFILRNNLSDERGKLIAQLKALKEVSQ